MACHGDHGVVATLTIGARQRVLVGPVAVFDTTCFDIGTELVGDEQFEDRHELIGHQRITATHLDVEGPTDHVDVGDAFVDVADQIGERTVLVGELQEVVDPAFQFEMRVVFGEPEIDRCDLDEVVTSTRVGVNAGDLDHLIDTHPALEQRIAELRHQIAHLGHPTPLRRRPLRQVGGRSQIRRHRALTVHPIRAPSRRHRQQRRMLGSEPTLSEFVVPNGRIELGIGQHEVVLDELGEHDPWVPNWSSIYNP